MNLCPDVYQSNIWGLSINFLVNNQTFKGAIYRDKKHQTVNHKNQQSVVLTRHQAGWRDFFLLWSFSVTRYLSLGFSSKVNSVLIGYVSLRLQHIPSVPDTVKH